MNGNGELTETETWTWKPGVTYIP